MVTLSELAAALRTGASTLRAWTRSGRFPRPLPGRRLRWDRASIERWLTQGGADHAASPR